eukprot:TRINITY_DN1396_c0_g1_i2.p2 TRINITY_DN1396_c0_g1~~TRINITY_DN1396_c0_g1_i2.p2  ORF type:complete len:186 (-),score=40.82 TRINITY_DN1396_c0_g1_i2:347-904(-)
MQCVVEGVIETQYVGALAELLQGLCGTRQQAILVHEMVFKNIPTVGAVPAEVHCLCSLTELPPVWTLRHVGGAMRGAGAEQLPVQVRSSVDCLLEANPLAFLATLGFKLDYETVHKGFAFQVAHRAVPLRVAVACLHRMPRLHAVGEAVPLVPGLHRVEMTAPAAVETYIRVGEAMVSFAEYLSP